MDLHGGFTACRTGGSLAAFEGGGGGLPIKLIWFFFGLILTLMVLSGLLIWTKRTAQATAAALKRSERAPRAARRETTVEIHP